MEHIRLGGLRRLRTQPLVSASGVLTQSSRRDREIDPRRAKALAEQMRRIRREEKRLWAMGYSPHEIPAEVADLLLGKAGEAEDAERSE